HARLNYIKRWASWHASNKPLRCQLLQQRLRLLQIARVKPLHKPPVNRSQQFARLLHLALVAPEPCEAHGGAEFPRLGLLLASDRERTFKVRLRFGSIPLRQLERNFNSDAISLGLKPSFLGCFDLVHRFADAAPSAIELAEFRIGFMITTTACR